MSEILDFVLNNFEILRSGDYLILATFVALVGAAVIFGFRAIYAARYQAQSDLLQLKDQTVGALTTHLEITTRERDDLREKMAQLGRLEESGTATEAELDYMHAEVLKLIAAYLIALLDRVAINYRVLFIYQTILGEIPPPDSIRLAASFRDKVDVIRNSFVVDSTLGKKDMASVFTMLQSKELTQTAAQAGDTIKALGNEIEARCKQKDSS